MGWWCLFLILNGECRREELNLVELGSQCRLLFEILSPWLSSNTRSKPGYMLQKPECSVGILGWGVRSQFPSPLCIIFSYRQIRILAFLSLMSWDMRLNLSRLVWLSANELQKTGKWLCSVGTNSARNLGQFFKLLIVK